MFKHLFLYRLKYLLRDRETVFWTMLFPILLAVFFNLAFSNLQAGENFETIEIAVVDDENFKNNEYLKKALDETSINRNEADGPMFHIVYTDKAEADSLLMNNKITGYILVDSDIRMVVKDTGINQTILKVFLDDFKQKTSTITGIVAANPVAINEGLIEDLSVQNTYISESPISKAKPNTRYNYFYALLAMACLYGSFWGFKEANDIQADQTPQAARINVAPVHKLKVIVYDLLAAILIHFVQILILLAFLVYIMHVEFGGPIGYILLTCLIGSITGISMGTLVGAVVKGSEGIKIGIQISVTMLLSFLGGMMSSDVKYLIAKNMPILGYINPVNQINEAFYSLTYFDSYDRFFLNITLLSVISIIFCVISYLSLRRRKYASI